jgi:hypothetical protein
MSGPRGGMIDWADPEQVKAYRAEYSRVHRDEINRRRRERRREQKGPCKPAGDGTITRDLRRRDEWRQMESTTENFLTHSDLCIGYDEMEKYRRIKEYE